MKSDYASIQITRSRARQIALELYGLKGEIKVLPGELDFNFRIKTEAESYILKVSRPQMNLDHLRFQQDLLKYLSSNSRLSSPVPIPDLQGKLLSEIRDASGNKRAVRLLTWVEGRLWSEVNPIRDPLLYSLGIQAGSLTSSLQNFKHPQAHRNFDWDLAQSDWIADQLPLFTEEQREVLEFFFSQYQAFQSDYVQLRKSVVHNDANDNNIIVSQNLMDPEVIALIDYGDAIHTQAINDLAIAIAYAVMNKPDPLSASLPLVKGYHQQFPLQEKELEFLFPLVAIRLVISVTKATLNRKAEPDNAYLLISDKAAWELLKRWRKVNAEFAHYCFRHACGFPAHPGEHEFTGWTRNQQAKLSTLFPSLKSEEITPLDLSVSSVWMGHPSELEDLEGFSHKLSLLQKQYPGRIIAGGYLEPRIVYTSPAYERPGNNGTESRTIHLGIDLWVPAGTPVHALFDGEVVTAVNDSGDKEYGGLIIVKHRMERVEFFTLHGHLALESLDLVKTGQKLSCGDRIGTIGIYPENGNWAPHLHFQLMLSKLSYINDFPGVAYPSELELWKSLCPDPNLLFKKEKLRTPPNTGTAETIRIRKELLGRSLSLSYKEPLKIVRGDGAFLIDHLGRRYLDTVNNVAHVGHEHPDVVKAGQQQMAVLNTNTRYLHDHLNEFARDLLDTFPQELGVVHFVNSGSEANELALRMARTYSGEKDMIAVEVGYHGNTTACVEVSSYKFDGKGGNGAPEYTHIVPLPDSYRGIYRGANTGIPYAAHIQKQIDHIQSLGRNVAGFICESILSCGGQIELPGDYLRTAYESVRKAGGLCIADEVQVGCGRVGSAFWGFQLHGVVPDIVTIGKPLGNGHPLAAVVCTKKVAEAFANGMEYFNTFGGNPVSCAIGREVLNVIKRDHLQHNALEVGNYLKAELLKLQEEYPEIGEVRGQGLFLGIELADQTLKPLPQKAAYLANRMKELGILMSTDGRDENVLKIKPPLVFSRENADTLLTALRTVFEEDLMKEGRHVLTF